MNLNELLTSQMGIYGQTFHNRVANLGATVVGLAVPMSTLSTGTRAMWMELYIPLASGSADPLLHNFDVAPADDIAGIGAILPQQTFAWYPVAPGASTLLVMAQGNSTRVNVSFYRQAVT